jgi:hypothetical protein
VTNSSSVQAWTLRMPAGSLQQWNFTFTTTAPGGNTPYPITGSTWEYVARPTATDMTSPPMIEITTSVTTAGVITVTDSAALSQVQLDIYPAATAALTPGTYFHALWANAGGTSALAWVTGLLIVEGNPQP